MKKMIVSAAAFAVVALSAVAMAPTSALANSAFARQTGQACSACHFQSIPRLNDFGRKFRINAFRDTGTQGLVEDEGLSLPASFNAGLNMELAISNGDTDTAVGGVAVPSAHLGAGLFGLPDQPGVVPGTVIESNTGVAWPTEAELVIGGRYGDNFGGVTSINLINGHAGLEHYKLAFVYDTEMGPVAIAGGSTANRGAAYLLNDPSNVFGQNLAGWGHQSTALALGGVNAGGATALGLYTHLNGMGYLALGGIIPAAVNSGIAVNFKLSPYVRAAFTGAVAGFDVVAGGWYYANKLGDYNAAFLGINNVTTTQYGLDLQVQGNVGDGVSVGFYLPWQIKGESIALATATSDVDTSGLYPMLTVGVNAPVHAGVRFGYDYANTEGKGTLSAMPQVDSKAWVIGAWLDVAQNVVVDLEYVNSTIETDPILGIPGTDISVEQDSITATVEYVY